MATAKKSKLRKYTPSDKAMRFVDFARWCINHNVEALDAAELVTLAQRAKRAGENYCNEGDRQGGKYERASELAQERFEEKANALGFSVTWPGLWPSLTKDGQTVYLPTIE